MTIDINLTQNCKQRMLDVLTKKPNYYFILKIIGGGCAGFSYILDVTKNIEDNEVIKFIEIEQDKKLALDISCKDIIKNLTIDFKEELIGGFFSFENPNATVKCGCGSSFDLD